MDNQNTNQPCCPKFDPTPWDGITHNWQDKLFIKKTIPVFFHIPLPSLINKAMCGAWDAAKAAGAAPELKDYLCIITDPTPFKSEFYTAVTKEVPGEENVKLTGTFMSKVFDGPYSAVPKWIKEFDQILAQQNKKAIRYYFYYTTCPKCAKIYGHNYAVAFAQIQ